MFYPQLNGKEQYLKKDCDEFYVKVNFTNNSEKFLRIYLPSTIDDKMARYKWSSNLMWINYDELKSIPLKDFANNEYFGIATGNIIEVETSENASIGGIPFTNLTAKDNFVGQKWDAKTGSLIRDTTFEPYIEPYYPPVTPTKRKFVEIMGIWTQASNSYFYRRSWKWDNKNILQQIRGNHYYVDLVGGLYFQPQGRSNSEETRDINKRSPFTPFDLSSIRNSGKRYPLLTKAINQYVKGFDSLDLSTLDWAAGHSLYSWEDKMNDKLGAESVGKMNYDNAHLTGVSDLYLEKYLLLKNAYYRLDTIRGGELEDTHFDCYGHYLMGAIQSSETILFYVPIEYVSGLEDIENYETDEGDGDGGTDEGDGDGEGGNGEGEGGNGDGEGGKTYEIQQAKAGNKWLWGLGIFGGLTILKKILT
ncbi:MAG: hypothetical protein LBN95_13760 [Prevotellaceae bacterium]|jgi:hypothetical protein|nr:hypothetical protein [Prevotellaceae bacterium]